MNSSVQVIDDERPQARAWPPRPRLTLLNWASLIVLLWNVISFFILLPYKEAQIEKEIASQAIRTQAIEDKMDSMRDTLSRVDERVKAIQEHLVSTK